MSIGAIRPDNAVLKMSPNLKGALFSLAAFTVFATHDVIVKLLGGTYSAIQIVFFSVIFGIPLVMFMLIRDAREGHLRPVHPWWTLFRTVAVVITGVSAFYAFSTLPLAQVYAILFAAPLLITVLAIPILGEVVRIRRWIAVIVGLTGVMIVLQPGATPLELGHLAALTAAIGGSFASIIVRKIGRDERTAVMMLYPMIANFLVMGALLPFVYKPVPIEEFGMMASIAVLGFTGALCLIAAYKSGEAVIVAPMQYSQIIWASVFGALFFDEQIGQTTAIGAGVIIASGLYIVLRESRGGGSENRPVLRTRSRVETGTAPRVSQSLDPKDRGP